MQLLEFLFRYELPEMSMGISKNIRELFKVGLSRSKKNLGHFLGWKPLKSNEKYFLFQLKRDFRSQDI